jgi:hypothetical protein
MEIGEYIMEGRLILIPVLYIIGMIIKNTSLIKNKYIPLLLLFLGILFSIFMGDNSVIDNIIQGVLVAGGAVLTNEVIVQSKRVD